MGRNDDRILIDPAHIANSNNPRPGLMSRWHARALRLFGGSLGNQHLSVESPDGHMFVAGKTAHFQTVNLWFDGTSWNLFDVTQPGFVVALTTAGTISTYTATAGANPRTLVGPSEPLKPPSCVAYNSVAQSVAHATLSTILLNTEVYDTHAFHTINTGVMTIPAGVDGLYVGWCEAAFASTTAASDTLLYQAHSTLGNLGISRLSKPATGAAQSTNLVSVTEPFRGVAGMAITNIVYQATGGPLNVTLRQGIYRLGGY